MQKNNFKNFVKKNDQNNYKCHAKTQKNTIKNLNFFLKIIKNLFFF